MDLVTGDGSPAAAERRIAALDGWRGISILLVICGHLVEYRYAGSSQSIESQVADVVSTLGVCIFFVISGLIITRLALLEQDTSGGFSARRFYTRRLFRIVPPFYLYLAFVLILTTAGAVAQRDPQTLQAAAFACNLPQADCGWFAGHSWSLAYEEQFYLLFPLLFSLAGRHVKASIGWLFMVLLGVPIVHYGLHLGQPWFMISHATFYFSFISAGALVATRGEDMKRLCNSRHAMYLSLAAMLILVGVLFLDVGSHFKPTSGRYFLGHGLLAPILEPVCVAWLVGSSVYTRGWGVRLLKTQPLQFVGMISYSLYLWQQPFTSSPSNYLDAHWLLFFPLMIVFGALSYYLVERPCVRLAKRFSGPPRPLLPPLLAPFHAVAARQPGRAGD